MPRDYGVSATFDVANFSPYLEDDILGNLRANSSQQGVDDVDKATKDQINILKVKEIQVKILNAQGIAQLIKDTYDSKIIQECLDRLDFVSLII